MAEKKTSSQSGADSAEDEDREYTEGTKMMQQFERGMTRAAYRMAHGFAEGVRTYYEESEKSAETKQDGVLRDSLKNSALGFSVAMEEMSKAPLEIAKATDSEAAWDFAQSMERAVRGDKKKDDKKDAADGDN